MAQLARRLLALSAVGLVVSALCAAAIMTDDMRREAACARDPAYFCGLGPGMLTSFGGMALPGFLVASLLVLGWWAAAHRMSPGPRAAGVVAAALLLPAAAAWTLSEMARRTFRGCGDEHSCQGWHGVHGQAEMAAGVLLAAALLGAILAWDPGRKASA